MDINKKCNLLPKINEIKQLFNCDLDTWQSLPLSVESLTRLKKLIKKEKDSIGYTFMYEQDKKNNMLNLNEVQNSNADKKQIEEELARIKLLLQFLKTVTLTIFQYDNKPDEVPSILIKNGVTNKPKHFEFFSTKPETYFANNAMVNDVYKEVINLT